MSEEKKKYEIIGKVEIGTDEYRDLIEKVADLKQELKKTDDARSDYYWKWQHSIDDLKKIKEELSELKLFVKEKELEKDIRIWKLEKQEDEDDIK